MSDDFTYTHYREILENALKAGYQITSFHDSTTIDKSKKVLYLRHDVDGNLTKALTMAKIESEMGISATYFLLLNSPLYNLLETRSLAYIQEIKSLGHWLGLHIDPTMCAEMRLNSVSQLVEVLLDHFEALIPIERVVSFHRPSPEVLNKEFPQFTSTYEPRFFSQIKYISDSRRMWREGDPCKILKEGRFDQIQLLVHPIWWGDEDDLRTLGESVLQERLKEIREYLATNITPFKDVLYEERRHNNDQRE